MSEPGLSDRLARIEIELRNLSAELDEVRRLASTAAPAASPAPQLPGVVGTHEPAGSLNRAWAALERGRVAEAVELAEGALRQAASSGDDAARVEVAALAAAAAGQAGESWLRGRIRELADRALQAAEPAPSLPAPAPPAQPSAEPAAPPRPVPARPSRPPVFDRFAASAASELSGARAFAVAGGVVTLLGIIFLFVLAANRGWIGPAARVSIGAAASLAVLTVGVVLRVRYGRLVASLAAVGTGIAGAYTTLAAATLMYGFLPPWGALLVAAGIASAGGVLALRWHSQILAGLSLVGAAAAPAAIALDEGIGAAGTAFAVVVFAAALAAAAHRRWLWLAVAVGATAVAQVVWLTGASAAESAGAIAVAAAAALVLLGGGIAWQAGSGEELDPFAATLALASGGLVLGTVLALLPDDRDAGLALASAALVYGLVAYATGRRWRDLGWVVAAAALLLAGVATALLFSEQSLTVTLAVESAVLATLAWRLSTPRFQLASLAYLALGCLHVLAIDLWLDRPSGDLPSAAAPGLLALTAAALVAGTLVLRARRDRRSVGLLARLEPVWDALVAGRGALRLLLYVLTLVLAAGAGAALLSGRWLTLAAAVAAVGLAAAAAALGERRLQAAGFALALFAAAHMLTVEARPDTLVLERAADALAPVPSLAALAIVSAALARLALYRERGIAFLGPLEGPERSLAWLGVHARHLRVGLLTAAGWLTVWTCALLLIAIAWEPGQAGATTLWAGTGVACAAVAARRRTPALALAAALPTFFAYGKAVGFDWDRLTQGWATAALLAASASVLLLGFFARYAAAAAPARLELASLACTVTATVSALVALDRVVGDHVRVLGAAALVAAAVVAALAVPPFAAWGRGRSERWLRDFATGYWSVALVTVGLAERWLAGGGASGTIALWAASSALVATTARPLAERRLWLAGAAGALLSSVACLGLVTIPSRLVDSSAHPGRGLWVLLVCVASLAWIASIAPEHLRRGRISLGLLAVALGVFGLSLGVLESAERVSGASVATDFQRGHTAVSALWGALALGLFIAGIVRENRLLQRLALALFGLALAKLFLYDLRSLSSVTRALSFLAVGGILLAAAFFAERIIHGGGTGGHGGARTA